MTPVPAGKQNTGLRRTEKSDDAVDNPPLHNILLETL